MNRLTAIPAICVLLGGACTTPVDDERASGAGTVELPGEDVGLAQPRPGAGRTPTGDGHGLPPRQSAPGFLLVRVVDDGSKAPVVGMRVTVRDGSARTLSEVTESHGGLDEMPLTNAEGIATLDIRPGYGFTLEVSHPHGLYGTRTKVLSAFPPGAQRDARFQVPLLADSSLRGRAVAAEDGSAIPGAELRLQEFPRSDPVQDAVELDLTGAPIAIADERGEFILPVTSYRPRAVLFTAPGRGPVLIWTPERGGPTDVGVEVRLPRAARLQGVLLNAPPDPPRPVLWLRTTLDRLAQPRPPFSDPRSLNWTSEVLADGSFSLDGLPPGVPLTVDVPSGQGLLRREPGPILLQPGEERAVTWRLGPQGALVGQVLEADGSPAVGVEVWLVAEPWARPEYRAGYFDELDRPAADTGTGPPRRAWSDEEGRFSFRELAVGSWLVGPAPTESIAPAIERIRITPPAQLTEIRLALHRGHFISGRVIDPTGAPVPSCSVWARGVARPGTLSCVASAAGEFALGPLVEGKYVLRAWPEDPEYEARSEPVEAPAGAGQVVLELARGGAIAGTVIYPGPGIDKMALIEAHNQDGRIEIQTSWAADGEFLVRGLEAGTYYLTAVNALFGRIGFVGPLELESGALLEGVEIPIEQSGTLDLLYLGPVEWVAVRVERDGAKIAGRTVRRGSRTLFSVPPGPCTVKVHTHDPDGMTWSPPIEFESVHELHAVRGEVIELIVDYPE